MKLLFFYEEQVSVIDTLFQDCFTSIELTQWIHEAATIRSTNILDLFLTTEDDRVTFTSVLPPFLNCDHCVTLCGYVFQFKPPSSPRYVFCPFWPRVNYKHINESLCIVDWEFKLQYLDANSAYSRYSAIISSLGKAYASKKVLCSIASSTFN